MRRWTLRIAVCLVLGCVTTVAVAWGLAYLSDARPDFGQVHDETGWPLHAHHREFHYHVLSTPQYQPPIIVDAGFAVSDDPNRPIVLPLRPIWPGFLIDALFYGVIWFGIFFGFGSARRALRKKRGRCPKCAYQLRGQLDAGCSECGWNRTEGNA